VAASGRRRVRKGDDAVLPEQVKNNYFAEM